MFAGVVVWKRLQLMLVLLLVVGIAEFGGILVWKLLQLIVMMLLVVGVSA